MISSLVFPNTVPNTFSFFATLTSVSAFQVSGLPSDSLSTRTSARTGALEQANTSAVESLRKKVRTDSTTDACATLSSAAGCLEQSRHSKWLTLVMIWPEMTPILDERFCRWCVDAKFSNLCGRWA